METKALTESALFVAIFVILALGAVYLPIMSIFMLLVLSVPHSILTWRRGLTCGLLAAVAAGVILFLFMDLVTAFMLISLFALVGVSVGYLSKRYTAGITLSISALVGAISFAIVLFVVEVISGLDLIADMITVYKQSILTINESLDMLQLDVDAINRQLGILATYLKPTLVLILGFMVSFINFKMFYIIGRRIKLKVPRVPTLFEWHFPKWLGLAYIISIALLYFTKSETMLNYLGININVLLKWPVLFQGVALIIKFMGQYIKSRVFYLLLFIVILTSPFLTQVVIILGLFDMFFDYQGWLVERRN